MRGARVTCQMRGVIRLLLRRTGGDTFLGLQIEMRLDLAFQLGVFIAAHHKVFRLTS